MAARADSLLRHPALLSLLWAAAVGAMAVLAGRYWIPLDDGTLAQSAERVLSGQLPHRDFGDPYSGLNAMVGAAAFKLLGVRLSSLRFPLVAGFALWLPAVWLLARRHLAPAAALVATAVAAVLSVPGYPAAMPGWFALYAVTWGAWTLTRSLDGGGRSWLAATGAAAGLAVLFKVVGLYFLAAALLAVAWRRAGPGRAYAAVIALGTLAFLALLGRLTLPGAGISGAYHFFLPAVGLCGALLLRVRSGGGAPLVGGSAGADGATAGREPAGLRPLFADGAVLTAGFLAPLAAFLIPYALSGSVGAWIEGVFLLPGRRLQAASSPPGGVWTVVPGVTAVLVAAAAARTAPRTETRLALALAALLALALALDDASGGAVMATLWYSLRGWIPALVLAALSIPALAAAGSPPGPAGPVARSGRGARSIPPASYALLAAAGLWALVQFPYAAPAYFFYAAPLGVLATAAAVSLGTLRAGPVLGLLTAVYVFLGIGYAAGVAATGTTPLGGPRGGIRVSSSDAALYGEVTVLVRSHLEGGEMWAGPDAPEVYFLAGVPNPTPTLYEFLDREPRSAAALDSSPAAAEVRVAVVNTRPLFSRPLDPSSLERVLTAFPEGATVGPFMVRWRTP